jgi:hypothetical protein
VHSTTLPPLQAIENIIYLLERSIPKWAFATALLPNVFGALLLGDLISLVNARSRILLHSGQDVTVEIKSDADAGMAQSLARDFRVNASGQHVGRVGMAKIVEPDAR